MFRFRRTRAAATEGAHPKGESPIGTVSQLVEMSGVDTLYRDHYVRRALAVFAELLPEAGV